MSNLDAMAAHSAYAMHRERVRTWPFPHLVVENFLDPGLFDALRSLDLSDRAIPRHPGMVATREGRRFSLYSNGGEAEDGSQVPEALATCRKVLAHPFTSAAMLEIFRPVVASRFKIDPLPWYPSIEFIEDREGYALAPHTDVSQKVVTCLIYLARDGADPSLGTRLYAPRPGAAGLPTRMDSRRVDPEALVEVCVAPYRPNTSLLFAPFLRSLHGVAATAPGTERRLLQYQITLDADAYNAALVGQNPGKA